MYIYVPYTVYSPSAAPEIFSARSCAAKTHPSQHRQHLSRQRNHPGNAPAGAATLASDSPSAGWSQEKWVWGRCTAVCCSSQNWEGAGAKRETMPWANPCTRDRTKIGEARPRCRLGKRCGCTRVPVPLSRGAGERGRCGRWDSFHGAMAEGVIPRLVVSRFFRPLLPLPRLLSAPLGVGLWPLSRLAFGHNVVKATAGRRWAEKAL